jgi:hypothetical protein
MFWYVNINEILKIVVVRRTVSPPNKYFAHNRKFPAETTAYRPVVRICCSTYLWVFAFPLLMLVKNLLIQQKFCIYSYVGHKHKVSHCQCLLLLTYKRHFTYGLNV